MTGGQTHVYIVIILSLLVPLPDTVLLQRFHCVASTTPQKFCCLSLCHPPSLGRAMDPIPLEPSVSR